MVFKDWADLEPLIWETLDSEEQANLEKLRLACTPTEQPDVCLGTYLRFLRARSSLDESIQMLRDHFQWRIDHDVDNLVNNETLGDFSPVGHPRIFCGVDREGSPVIINRVVMTDIDTFFGPEKLAGREYVPQLVRDLEITRRYRLLLCSIKQGDWILGTTTIVDLTGISFTYFFQHLSTFFDVLQQCREHLAGNYPEMVKRVFIINMPAYAELCWKVASRLLPASTQTKIQFIGEDELGVLQDYICPSQLPKFLGGEMNMDDSQDLAYDGIPYQTLMAQKFGCRAFLNNQKLMPVFNPMANGLQGFFRFPMHNK